MKLVRTLTSPPFQSSVVLAAVQQVCAGYFWAYGLLEVWAYSLFAFWIGVVVIAVRRSRNPTRVDIFLIKFGFVPLLLIATYLTGLIWQARGAG